MPDLSRYHSTGDVCRILRISRATLYNWPDAVPDAKAPGSTGALLWSRRTIERLARSHDRTPEWET